MWCPFWIGNKNMVQSEILYNGISLISLICSKLNKRLEK